VSQPREAAKKRSGWVRAAVRPYLPQASSLTQGFGRGCDIQSLTVIGSFFFGSVNNFCSIEGFCSETSFRGTVRLLLVVGFLPGNKADMLLVTIFFGADVMLSSMRRVAVVGFLFD
jgi:hypothetical protein